MAWIERRLETVGDLVSGGFASGAFASGSITSGTIASGAIVGFIGATTFDIASGTVGGFNIGTSGIITAAGQVNSGLLIYLGSGAVISGIIGSGSLPAGKATGLMDTIVFSGIGTQSGAAVAVSGIALASGSFTPRNTGKIIIQADAYANSIASGQNVTFWISSGLSGQAGAAIFVSGWQLPPQTFQFPASGAQVQFGQTMLVSGLVAGTAYPVALFGNNMNSGTGSLLIQEILN